MEKSEFEYKDDYGHLITFEYSYTKDGRFYTVEVTGAYLNLCGNVIHGDEYIVDLDVSEFDEMYLKELIEESLQNKTPYEDR